MQATVLGRRTFLKGAAFSAATLALAACAAAETVALDSNTRQALALLRAEIALIRGDVDTARQLIQIVRQTLQPGGTVGQ